MSLFRIILLAIAGFFVFRLVRLVARMMMNAPSRDSGAESVGGGKPTRPLDKPFRDATDASFEDLTGTGNKKPPGDRPS
jgi:hypothetical protein